MVKTAYLSLNVNLPPVVDNGLELGFVAILHLGEPLSSILVFTVNLIDFFVSQHDKES